MTLTIRGEALAEIDSALRYYAQQSPELMARLFKELQAAQQQIVAFPFRWPKYARDTRHYLLPRFPYRLVYRIKGDNVRLLAVAHVKRRPGYWQHRT